MSSEENVKHQEEKFAVDMCSTEALKNPIQRERIDKAIALIGGPGLKVLDVGCSDGSLSELIHANGNECWGVDLPSVVDRVPEERKTWFHEFSCDVGQAPWIPSRYGVFGGEVHALGKVGPGGVIYGSNVEPVPTGFFDVIWAGEIIEHFFDIAPFFEEAHRVLKPGGRLVMTTPNAVRGINRIAMLNGDVRVWHEWETIPHHVRYWTPNTLAEALEKYGFKPRRWDYGRSQAEGDNEIGFDDTWLRFMTPMERIAIVGYMKRMMDNPILRHSFIVVEAVKT